MFHVIVALGGQVLGRRGFDQESVRIGRDSGTDIRIDHPALSRQHAVIHREGDAYLLRDLSSENGTFLGGQRIEVHALNDGDEITFGGFTITFYSETPAQPSQAEVLDPAAHAVFGRTLKLRDGQDHEQRERSANVHAHLAFDGNQPYPLVRDVSLIGGGDGCEIKLPGLFAPRVAAVLIRGHGGWSLAPFTRLLARRNGQPFSGRIWLEAEDRISVGALRFIFHEGLPTDEGDGVQPSTPTKTKPKTELQPEKRDVLPPVVVSTSATKRILLPTVENVLDRFGGLWSLIGTPKRLVTSLVLLTILVFSVVRFSRPALFFFFAESHPEWFRK